MASPDRIRTMRHLHAMVALDTFDLLEARVRKLLSYGRRISMTQRYTYTESAPDLKVGLTLDTQARGGGVATWKKDDAAGVGVFLKPGLLSGFGFSAYASDGNATESEAWKRFHAKKATAGSYFDRRRDMTEIELSGGMGGDTGPGNDEYLVIRAWNSDGVCDERVIGFDTDAYWAALRPAEEA